MKKLLLMWIMLLGMGGVIFADGITSYEPDQELTSIEDGDIVAIYNKAENKYLFGSDAQNLGYGEADNAFASSNSGWLFKVEEHEGHFLFLLQTPAGSDYGVWGNPGYLNSQPASSGCSFILGLKNQWGQDGPNLALWDIEAVEGGFKLKNVGTGLYLNSNAPAKFSEEDAVVWTFCTLKEKQIENPIAQPTRTATDANTDIFSNFKAIGGGATWDPATKVFTGTCGWQWDGDGADFSQYRYIVITTGSSREESGAGYMKITDKNGVSVGGDQYGEAYQNMWFSTWNHLFCCKIDLEKLRQEKMLDIYHITELTIDGGDYFLMGTAYASNQEPQVRNRWGQNEEGSYRIQFGEQIADKFGTICLPYQAAVACAKIYEITGAGTGYVELAEVDGLMEAGKPYFYCTTENTTPEYVADGVTKKTNNNVFFYQATAATVASPVENNGLIGTFTDTTAPQGDNFYVLSSNKLYYTTGATVNVGANKAYIDMSKIVNKSSEAKGRITIDFNDIEATGIESVNDAANALNSGKMYDLSGREVTNPTSGIYIMGGKKIIIK